MPDPVSSVTAIRPRSGWPSLGLAELWEHRELLAVMASRDIKVRYKQTLLGATWAILQPVILMVVFSIFFGRLAGISSDGLPYPLFAFAALVPWTYFGRGLMGASHSLLQAGDLLNKIYFPRLILPLAPVLASLLDFVLALATLFGIMLWYGVSPSPAVIALPLLVLLMILTVLSLGLWLAALQAHYRDVRFLIAFIMQAGFLCSPIAYSSGALPEKWRTVYGLNPMASVIEGFRWALLGKASPGPMLWVSVAVVALTLVTGLVAFRRMERTLADVI